MKVPTLAQAASAIAALSGSSSVETASDLVGIVTNLFDDDPEAQDALKGTYEEAKHRTDAALDRLDASIAAEEKGEK